GRKCRRRRALRSRPADPGAVRFDLLDADDASPWNRVRAHRRHRLRVAEAVEIVREAGLPISAVTVEPAAIADYLCFVGVPLAAVATSSGSREFLTLCANGLVVSSHHLDRRRTLLESALREM